MGTLVQSIELYYRDGSSDKVYNVQLEGDSAGHRVCFQYGRRGSTLASGEKVSGVGIDKAQKVYEKLVVEKTGKGYTDDPSGTPGTFSGNLTASKLVASKVINVAKVVGPLVLPQLLNPIDEDEVEGYLADDAYGSQEKHNGKHMMIRVRGKEVTATNKKGKPCGFSAAYESVVLAVGTDLLVDIEAIGDKMYAYDLLELGGEDLRPYSYEQRYKRLAGLGVLPVSKLAVGAKAKRAMFADLMAKKKEGIVFKRLNAVFSVGRPASGGDMLKHKFYAMASVIVAPGNDGKHSVGMELIDAGKRVFVGNCTVPQKKALPVIGSIFEVQYLYAHKGGSLYQPIYLGPRDDIDIDECLITQLKYKAEED